jgi:hypothetical protein
MGLRYWFLWETGGEELFEAYNPSRMYLARLSCESPRRNEANCLSFIIHVFSRGLREYLLTAHRFVL